MLCPRCEQGDVIKATVLKTGVSIYICIECDAAWLLEQSIGVVPYFDFGTYMEKNGFLPSWDELHVDWYGGERPRLLKSR